MNTSNDKHVVEAKVREVLAKHGNLSLDPGTLPEDTSLSEAGMTSHATVNVMLALEAVFGELPEHMLTRSTFRNIASISAAMQTLPRY
jgi:acyl carrier protein